MEYRPQLRDKVRDLVAEAKERAKTLKADAEAASHVERVWEGLLSFMSKGWPLHILDLLDKEVALLKAIRAEGNPSIQAIEDVYRDAKEQAAALNRRYPGHLEDACRAAAVNSTQPLARDILAMLYTTDELASHAEAFQSYFF